MTQKSDNFERQIERIHELVESDGATVTWDDHIPDPDNPTQRRQIDIAIRYAGKLTIVECRLHQEPQDVKWIEELIGRRQSLQADAVIAVSASGFTLGARRKAHAHGIILRDFRTLSEDEVRLWGKQTAVTLTFFQFEQVNVAFSLESRRLPMPAIVRMRNGRPIAWRKLFEIISGKIDDEHPNAPSGSFDCELDAEPFLVSDLAPTRVRVTGRFKRITTPLPLVSAVKYLDPNAEQVAAYIEKYYSGEFEIIQAANESVSAIVDLSQVAIPENAIFYTSTFDFGRVVTLRNVQFIGLHNALRMKNKISFRFDLI